MRHGQLAESQPSLRTMLDSWSADDVRRHAVADIVIQIAQIGVRLAELIATSPLGAPPAGRAPESATDAGGDPEHLLDLHAERLFLDALSRCDVAAVCSEDSLHAVGLTPGGALVVTLDPIDGSSNIDINAPIGSIFAVLPAVDFVDDPAGALLQPGRSQLAAGILLYGPSVMLALTWGEGTHIYALDPATGTFTLAHQGVALPTDAREYAINASNARHWGPGIRAYVDDLISGSLGPRERDFTMRWVASLVADTYRILRRGGIFLYPADGRSGYHQGRIRLVYEANPVAFLCEQAGGTATDGITPILDLQPLDLHQRTPLFFGSREKVERVRRYLLDPRTTEATSPLFSARGLFRD